MAKPRARTLYLEGHSVTRAPHYVARKFCYVDFQIFPCRQRVDCRGSRVDSRGLRFAVRGSRFTVRGLWFAGRGSRFRRLLRRRSGGVARLPCYQRHSDHHRFRCVAPCRSTRVMEGLAWDRTPTPQLGALLAHTKGPGPLMLKCVWS